MREAEGEDAICGSGAVVGDDGEGGGCRVDCCDAAEEAVFVGRRNGGVGRACVSLRVLAKGSWSEGKGGCAGLHCGGD